MNHQEFYNNRPITVEEQVAHQNYLPFIKNIYTFYGSNSKEDSNLFELNTDNPYFDLNKLKEKDEIRVKLFYNVAPTQSSITLDFPRLEQALTLNVNVVLKNNKFYVLQVIKHHDVLAFKVIDSEEAPRDTIFNSYCIVDKCINAAIDKSTNFIGYNLISKHISLTSPHTAPDKIVDDLEDQLKEFSKYININYLSSVIRNKEYILNDQDDIVSLDFDYGFDPNNFPFDLKQAIMQSASFLYQNRGELVVWGSERDYHSYDSDDIEKNILINYRGYSV